MRTKPRAARAAGRSVSLRRSPPLLFFSGLAFCLAGGAWAAAPGASFEQVVIVFKTHFDIGYTDLASNVVKRYRTTMIDDALKVVDQNRPLPPVQQFAWTLPGWPLSKIMEDWAGQTAERKERVQQAFKEGRFVVHALPFTTHTETLGLEDLVRGLGFASRLSRQSGLSLPRDAKMTDVPCHAWIMPTLLRQAGVDFLHLGCNAASSSPQVPRLFWWEGPDGSRLLTMYTAESYGTGLVPPANWPYKTWLALIHTGDNHGPPTPAEVKQLLNDAAKRLPGVKVRIGRLSDFADGLLAEKADIPVVRGDMPDTWIHGPMCDPQGAKLARTTRPAIATTESLHTMLGAWGVPAPDLGDTLAKAYEQSLLYGEHTWGGALYWVTKYGSGTKWGYGDTWRADHAAGRFQRLEDSWAEHTSYIEKARDLVAPLLQTEMQSLADAVVSDDRGPSDSRARIVVHNPLPWKRSGVVVASVEGTPLGKLASSGRYSRTIEGNTPMEPGPYDNDGVTFRLGVRDLPPLGYRTYCTSTALLVRSAEPPDSPTLENPFLKVVLDPDRGTVKSFVDKGTSRELIDPAAPFGFGQHLYERFDSNNVAAFVKAYVKINADWAINELGKPSMPPADKVPYRAAKPSSFKLRFERSYATRVAVMEAPATAEVPYAVTTKISIYPDEPYFDLEMTVRGKPADPWPEAGWICLPFKVDAPEFRLGRQGSIVDPLKDIVRGANKHLYTIDTGVAIFGLGGAGVGLCPLDSPLVSLDQPGCWKYSLDFVPKKPAVFVNLFNNQWTTNFRLWNQGTWTSRVRIWAFGRYSPAESLIVPSLEARYPMQAAASSAQGGKLPLTQRGLEISGQGALVTAFGPNPDGSGTLLRLWELAGLSANRTVRLPDGMKALTARPVDLRGRPAGEPIPLQGGSFNVPLKAFAPASFIVE
jgi:alpha-mannosidase